MLPKAKRTQFAIPEPCGPTIVQTILRAHLDNPPPTAPPTYNPKYITVQHRLSCEHDRYTLYVVATLSRCTSSDCECPVYQIFNHAAKHTYYIE